MGRCGHDADGTHDSHEYHEGLNVRISDPGVRHNPHSGSDTKHYSSKDLFHSAVSFSVPYGFVEPAGVSFETGVVFGFPTLPAAGSVELGGLTELVP